MALGFHTGHWEVGLLMQAAALEFKRLQAIPFAAYCSDPCDGRTQGTTGMMDSLAYRNDAATVLRRLGLLEEEAWTVSGLPLGKVLDWWEQSARRRRMREALLCLDGVHPEDVILSPGQAKRAGLTSTITFPRGNIAPQGSVIKSTAIDPSVVDPDGVYRLTGRARVFVRESDAVRAIKSQAEDRIHPGDVIVLCGRGARGSGMEEVYQITSALRHLPFGKEVALVTDARFSGVSTGACIGHVGPEALAGGPVGKLLDGDRIQIMIDRERLQGSLDLVGSGELIYGAEEGARVLAQRNPRPDLSADPNLPDDTRLWAALQEVGGGTWGGCVYDVDEIVRVLEAGKSALTAGRGGGF